MGIRAERKEARQKIRERLGQLTVKQIVGDYEKLLMFGLDVIARNLRAVLTKEEFELVKRFPDEVLEIVSFLGRNLSFEDMAKIRSAVRDGIRNMS